MHNIHINPGSEILIVQGIYTLCVFFFSQQIFWTWVGHYSDNSLILLIDSNDTYFRRGGEVIGFGTGKACTKRTKRKLYLYEVCEPKGKIIYCNKRC